MSSFVVIYDRRNGHSSVHEYSGPDSHRRAFAERLRLESENHDSEVEIVSLVSDSLESIKRTHSRYFANA
ncbi:MAG: hypothetical protein CVT64_11435 [Actinobacteria bacterium HGW-Actinobacteria-4]|nr:MAG: hypothetical protein CVT64_11435 [Actinobacteria bacterium HGW-Actinobacteria-4]